MSATLCKWCENLFHKSNMSRHHKSCFYKNEIEMTKSDFNYMKRIMKFDIKQEKSNEICLMDLKQFLVDLFKKVSILHNRIVVDEGKDPLDKIEQLNLSERTKQMYKREWKLFDSWLTEMNKKITLENANEYISSLKCKDSTQRRKHMTLQIILKEVFDSNMNLNKYRKRVETKPKKPFTNDELTNYLLEQKSLDPEDYLIQRLLATFGLRINSIASLKVSNLEFLNSKNKSERLIHFPDSKVKRRRVENVDSELEKLLRDFIRGKKAEDYVFYSKGSRLSESRRARDLSERINNRLRKSKMIEKSSNYLISSHCFRKTKAYSLFNEKLNLLKEETRAAIGQSQGSTAIESYIN